MGALKLMKLAGQAAPKNETKPAPSKGKDKDGALNNAFRAFGDWITSPGGIITILAVVGLVLYINHKTAKK